jgi:hypothetical protein
MTARITLASATSGVRQRNHWPSNNAKAMHPEFGLIQ